MQDNAILPGVVLVSLATTAVLITLLAVGLSRPGPQRPGLVAGALPLALLQPLVAAAYASLHLIDLFSGIAQSGYGGMRPVLDACASLWMLQRMAWGVFAASCVGGLLISLFRRGPSAGDVPCSLRRGLVLFLLPALGLLAAGTLTVQLAKAMRVTVAVVSGDEHDPAGQKRYDAVLEAEGLQGFGSKGSIAPISGFIARRTIVGGLGGAALGIALLGLALSGFILTWRVRFGAPFLALASVAWLLAAALAALVSSGVIDPLRIP